MRAVVVIARAALGPEEHCKNSLYEATRTTSPTVRCVSEKDGEYEMLYSEGPAKFMQAMLNRLTYLRNKYKKLHGRFSKTSMDIDPSQPNTSNNLLEQVISEFPWYEVLNGIWKNNPTYAPKTFLSAPGADHASDMIALTLKCKGKQVYIPPSEAEDETMETTDDPSPAVNPTPPSILPPPSILTLLSI
ncbi:uncharacterized protein HD556DRAFT_1448385 [Suillus plorans]|uniref:Uncharacterized protein n=1 Tax=Suillus plorans TaxID=116603 RepID=A0A9P7AES7_9AGAM|nr:uncharacterized protein HD556DRAFT_1448385 [Suillus plorans]KAG1787879.1 hypothetical protein HD556DRAFT_1448385 [Suillus plorans]